MTIAQTGVKFRHNEMNQNFGIVYLARVARKPKLTRGNRNVRGFTKTCAGPTNLARVIIPVGAGIFLRLVWEYFSGRRGNISPVLRGNISPVGVGIFLWFAWEYFSGWRGNISPVGVEIFLRSAWEYFSGRRGYISPVGVGIFLRSAWVYFSSINKHYPGFITDSVQRCIFYLRREL